MICYALLGDKSQLNRKAPLDSTYDRRTDSEFEEKELRDAYILAIPDLTINDEMRERELRRKAERELKDIKTLEIEMETIRREKDQALVEVTSRLSHMEQERKEDRHQMDALKSVIVKGILEGRPAADISKLDPLLTQELDSVRLRIIGQDGKETVVTLPKQSVVDNLAQEDIHLLEKISSGKRKTSSKPKPAKTIGSY
jgi:hypothetical protein